MTLNNLTPKESLEKEILDKYFHFANHLSDYNFNPLNPDNNISNKINLDCYDELQSLHTLFNWYEKMYGELDTDFQCKKQRIKKLEKTLREGLIANGELANLFRKQEKLYQKSKDDANERKEQRKIKRKTSYLENGAINNPNDNNQNNK
jgi:hypothetical protein